jgi:hypothetical protein
MEIYAKFVKVIESRRIRWAGHVTRMREMEIHAKFWLENV